MSDSIYILVIEGYADWEPALALCELRRSAGADVTVVGFTKDPVTSMGGLQVVPSVALGDVHPENVRLFMVPGGDRWENEGLYPSADLTALLGRLHAAGTPIAGICAGTIALARAGLLDDRAHTSNFPDYLPQNAADYRGSDRYRNESAVRERGVITANGLGYVEFARAIFDELDVLTPEQREWWSRVYRSGEWSDPPGSDSTSAGERSDG